MTHAYPQPRPYGTPDDILTSEEHLYGTVAGTLPAGTTPVPNTKVSAITKARLRYNLAEVAAKGSQEIYDWLKQTAEGLQDDEGRYIIKPDPARAVELLMELASFTTPKLKAVAIDANITDNADVKRMSFEQLQRIVSEQ